MDAGLRGTKSPGSDVTWVTVIGSVTSLPGCLVSNTCTFTVPPSSTSAGTATMYARGASGSSSSSAMVTVTEVRVLAGPSVAGSGPRDAVKVSSS